MAKIKMMNQHRSTKGGRLIANVVPPAMFVLVVDDDPAVRELSASILTSVGFQTLTAENGKQVIPLSENYRLNLVMTDLVMPEQEGLETIMALRRCQPHLPIIAMGDDRHGSYLQTARLLGAQGTLIKPFSAAQLLSMVHDLVGPATGGFVVNIDS